MINRTILIMLIMVLFTTKSFASSLYGLKMAFDELNYALTVEWDQNNKDFYHFHVKKFDETIEELRTHGLTNEEMKSFAVARVPNQQFRHSIQEAVSDISLSKMSSQSVNEYLTDIVNNFYYQGSSWNGSTAGLTIGALWGTMILLLILNSKPCPEGMKCAASENRDPRW